MSQALNTLEPADKFGQVEPGIYRSAYPTPANFAHLRLLNLKTVINLSQEALMRSATALLTSSGTQLVDVGLQVWTHPKCEPISHELIKEAMRYVLDSSYHPLLVVSASGTQQVGALVGCLRRLQMWSLASTFDEYRCFAAPATRLNVETFIEMWDNDLLTLPPKELLPRWFVQQQLLLADDVERWRELHQQEEYVEEEEEEEQEEEEEGEDAGAGEEGEEAGGMAPEEEEDGQQADEAEVDGEVEVVNPWADADPWTYFRVAGELVPAGTVTTTIDRDD